MKSMGPVKNTKRHLGLIAKMGASEIIGWEIRKKGRGGGGNKKKDALLWGYTDTVYSCKVTKKIWSNHFLLTAVHSRHVAFGFSPQIKVIYPMLHNWDLAICYIAIWFCLSWILTIKHLLKTLLVKPFFNNCGYYLLIVIHLHNYLGPPSGILTHTE